MFSEKFNNLSNIVFSKGDIFSTYNTGTVYFNNNYGVKASDMQQNYIFEYSRTTHSIGVIVCTTT